MAATVVRSSFRLVENLSKLFAVSLRISSKEFHSVTQHDRRKLFIGSPWPVSPWAGLSTSAPRRDLMEFFDDPKNWGAIEVRCGRSWRKEELRIKSNTDLHKLWYVLLKERNMLLTMEHECRQEYYIFPSPERIDKVEESMRNLEDVVRERNRAYHELESGETGERQSKLVYSQLGLKYRYREIEHCMPSFMNSSFRENYKKGYHGKAVTRFRRLYFEKKYLEKKKARRQNFQHVIGLFKRYPNLDKEAIKEQYPDVPVEKVLTDKRTRGHFDSNLV